MTAEDRERLRMQLIIDEGLRQFPYTDTVGKLTIGVGRNLTDVGISKGEAFYLLENDINKATAELVERFPWVLTLNAERQCVLINLCFNMGLAGLAKFVNTLAAVRRGDYAAAAQGLRNSLWYRQVGKARSGRLIRMMETGRWPGTLT